eukprot:2158069-Alexandrium_andersonii.AAC.1
MELGPNMFDNSGRLSMPMQQFHGGPAPPIGRARANDAESTSLRARERAPGPGNPPGAGDPA